MTVRALLSFLFALAVMLPAPLLAENKKAGRNADGQAYRIDENGFEIVDHVAELEVTVDDLQRQLHALENELSDKRSRIDSLETGVGRQAIKEESVLERQPSPSTPSMANRAPAANCEAMILPLRARISDLESQLNDRRVSATPNRNLPAAKTAGSNEIASLKNHITELQAALMESPSKESFQSEQSARTRMGASIGKLQQQVVKRSNRITELETQISKLEQKMASGSDSQTAMQSLKDELAAKEQKEIALGKKVALLSGQLKKLEGSLSRYSRLQRQGSSRSGRAALSSRSGTPMISSDSNRRRQAAPTGAKYTVASAKLAKGQLGAKVSKLNVLVSKRKRLLDNLRKRKRTVTISGRPLVTRDGVAFGILKRQVGEIGVNSNLSQIRSGLNEIEAILTSDIRLIQKLGKVG